MAKKLISGLVLASLAQIWSPNVFSWVLPLLNVRHYYKLSLYIISRKKYDLNSRKWRKTLFWTDR